MNPDQAHAPPGTASADRPSHWQRTQKGLWLVAGFLSLSAGIVGIFLPLLPTTPFVLLAAFCFARGSARWEAWLLAHPRFGPLVVNWRMRRAVPLKAKWLATVMMTIGCTWGGFAMPGSIMLLPAAICLPVALWLWSLPSQ